MATREATCHCGQLRLEATGDPFLVSICHCLACQRRTGSAFGIQAAFAPEQVSVTGRHEDYSRISDEADRKEHVFHFCPECGSSVWQTEPDEPDAVVVFAGAFADPSFPPPTEAGYDSRRHPWLTLPKEIACEAYELWAEVLPLYERGAHAEAADRGNELLDAHPDYAGLLYNVACCESLAGRTEDALRHLERAFEASDRYRESARTDADLDALRGEPAFERLLGR